VGASRPDIYFGIVWRPLMIALMSPLMARSDDLRRANTLRILQAVRTLGSVSRTDLAARTGLSPATVSTITAGLMQDRVLSEANLPSLSARRGRPQVALCLDQRAALVATVALSLNSARFTFFDFTGHIVFTREARIETREANNEEINDALAYALSGMMAELPVHLPPVRQISLGVQGVVDISGRVMLWSPITAGSVDFADGLEARLGIPVTVANDSDATAVALRKLRPELYGGDFVSVAMTDGIGMSIVIGGRLFSGVRSSAAEFGHMVHEYQGAQCRCGRNGCIEAYASDYAIWRNAKGEDPHSQPKREIDRAEFAVIARTALERDGVERAAFKTAARALGVGLRNVFALIDPAPVALVGFGGEGEQLLEPELRVILKDAFQANDGAELRIGWYPDAGPLISNGAAERGLDLMATRIAASTAGAIADAIAAE
jgi:predicted NBD/HSP70 family sugar kinase